MWLAHCYTHKETLECIEEFIFMYNGQPIPVQAKKRIKETLNKSTVEKANR